MTVQLSTLRVAPELDASKYSAGAQEKVAADKAMAASSIAAGQAVTATDAKISQAGDVLARLSRQYEQGYASQQRFNQGLGQLSRGLEAGKISIDGAQRILVGMNQKLGLMGDASEIAARGQVQLAAAVKAANAQIAGQAVAADSAVASAKRLQMVANDNIGVAATRFRRQNLMFQAQDIGVSLAGGMNPLMVLAQQGSQISGAYAGNGGVNALLKDAASLAGTLVTRLGPIAAVAGAGALAISHMRDELEKSEGRAVSFGEVAKATFSVIADDVSSILKPVTDVLEPAFEKAWDAITKGAIYAGNMIINSFHAAFVDVMFMWNQLPNAMSAVITGGANALIAGTEMMINTAAGYIDGFIAKVNAIADKMSEWSGGRFKGHINPVGTFEFGRLDNQGFDDLTKAVEERNRMIEEIMKSDPLGDYYRSVRKRVGDALVPGASDGGDAWGNLRDVNRDALSRARDEVNELQRQQDQLRGGISGFFSDLADGVTKGGDIGRNIKESILNALNEGFDNILKRLFDDLANSIVNAMGGDTAGSWLGTFLGVTPSKSGGRGGVVGDIVQAVAGDAWSGMRGANDNYASGAVTRAPLAPIGSYGNDLASNIRTLAGNIGANPRDLAALMSFESGFNPNIWGGAGGRHFGLIQAGGPERATYGITPGGSLASQFAGIERYFVDRGFKPGMSGLDLYSTVNAGRPGLYNASDAKNGGTWGTVADKWNSQMGPHFEKADKLLGNVNRSLDKFGTEISKAGANASQGLNEAAGGLSKFGQGLSGMIGNTTGGGIGTSFLNMLVGSFGQSGWNLANTTFFNPTDDGFANMLGLAKGGAFSGGNVIPFARGGAFTNSIVDRPTLFPFSKGTGLMGEAGPEAIMPLRRGPNGSLGVAMHGGGGGVVVNINNMAGASIQTEERTNADGTTSIDVLVDRVVADKLSTRGTASNNTMRQQFGARSALKRR